MICAFLHGRRTVTRAFLITKLLGINIDVKGIERNVSSWSEDLCYGVLEFKKDEAQLLNGL
jgi:hypothetical protein